MDYIIKNDKLTVKISDKGAEIRGLTYLGKPYMHNGDKQYWGGVAPILWPNIGAIKDGYALFNGTKYPMRKHGFLRDSILKVESHVENAIEFSLTDSEETRKIYPFHFKVIVSYVLEDATLRGFIEVENLSECQMPFNLGLHPAFKIPLNEDENPESYIFKFGKGGTYEMPTVNLENGTIDFMNRCRQFINLDTLKVTYSDYDYDALVFENIATRVVTLSNEKSTHGVKVSFDDFPMLGIWTPTKKQAPFICIEPWIGCADSGDSDHIFENKRDIIKLQPKERFVTEYRFDFF